jgi:hypothetical protein
MLDDMTSINAFLYFGYVPSPDLSLPAWLDGIEDRRRGEPAGREDLPSLIAEGVSLLKKIFQDTLAGRSTAHVVPLSGGLDSRAILGGLLENVESREIQAVTFGSPGTWDYEIGREVARAAGVRCETIDLSSQAWSWDASALVKTAGRMAAPAWVFDAHVNRQIPERFGAANVYWSGFMGDPLSGSHLLARDSIAWDQSQRRFVEHNRLSASLDLTRPGFDPRQVLPPSPLPGGDGLCYDEQLDFAVRQECLIRRIVLPAGYEYRTPFLHPEWGCFMLNAPRPYRQGQYLYKEILKAAYPRLFSLSTKANLGLPLDASAWRRQARILKLAVRGLARRIAPGLCYSISPGLNYIDVNRDLRRRKDLQATVGGSIRDLKKRGVVDWIDPEDVWQKHQRGQGNHADALILLASLEVLLKARVEVTA